MVTDHTTELMFVYRLHGQTGRFTDWTIGKKNSGLVNSIPESRFPFAQISSLFLVPCSGVPFTHFKLDFSESV